MIDCVTTGDIPSVSSCARVHRKLQLILLLKIRIAARDFDLNNMLIKLFSSII